MVDSFDPFEILGVRPDATSEQIRAAYRELAVRYHPDKHRGNPLEELAAAKLVQINQAYEILSDDTRRAEYVAQRRRTSQSVRPASAPRPPTAASPPSPAAVAMKFALSLGLIVALLSFLKFGLALWKLGGEIFVIVRGILSGIVLGILWILRLSPILGVAVLMAIVLGAGYFVRSRKGHG
jgi:hypothetical protein